MDQLVPRLAQRFKENGHSVELLTNNGLIQNCDFSLAIFSKVNINKNLNQPITTILWMLFFYPIYSFFTRVDLTIFFANPIITPISGKSIAIIHDLNEFENLNKYGKLRGWYRRNIMLRFSCFAADHLIAISKHTQEHLCHYLGIKYGRKTSTVLSGVPEPNLQANLTKNAVPYILTVGRLDPEGKNLIEALTLFRQLRQIYPTLHWKLAGGIENPMDQRRSSSFITKLQAEPNVEILGYVNQCELEYLYQSATAVLFYSKQEGFGFPLLEAFSYGCPVITHPNNLAAREIAGGLAFSVTPSQPLDTAQLQSLMLAIKSIDPNHLIKHAEKFSWGNAADRYYQVLSSRL